MDKQRVRGSLNQEEIVTVALEIAEAEGADALAFRRLGKALGVAPTAVLRHFRDKDDLLLALGARLLEDAFAQVDEDEPDWRERLLSLARATRRSFEAHPRVALLVANRTLRREAEFRAADLVFGAVQQAGLGGREAASVYLTRQGCGLHGAATSQLESSAHEVVVSHALDPPLLAR
ncbi:TetR/AcrR family transcriptional regulator [Actinoplanes sp. KI2]|uniref:TetR/AcrR family transcriptional regulator n=1 Tax=Actinoplanes sp. KI2 TaxID=2983315 RepID=UPI0021D61026|nr:TetR/AcrR family transcriptional regulator [Actinoplanes sp. KI2]MCU7726431.1 TetR/AcrR family transcriptional regulator [Actinoplanes sp. KI2]